MRIKRLKLSGFKSFVEPAELRIEAGLTGVVGPNGCGKSNLLEAIRWVMGESSAKSLRGGGMEDVIFAGTTQRPARDFAEVSLLVERAESATDQDLEAEVVRRIERGAGSAYRINGRDVRQKDVGLLFADAATGAHSPALVSQGKIAAVIAAKPAERRAMLEEAAGIAGLHVRRKDAEQKLRATETNLTRLDELIGDMETRAGQLRRQAKAAERYRTLSTAIRLAEARLIFARWRDAAAAADAARADAVAADAEVAERSQAQAAAEAAQTAAVDTLGAARAAADAAREAASEIGHRLSAARAQRVAIERRLADLDRQRATIADDRGREDVLAVDAAEALKRLAEEEKTLDTGLKAAAERVAGLDRQLAAFETASQAAEVDLARAVAAEAAEQAELRVAQAALAAARTRAVRAVQASERLAGEAAQIGDVQPLIARRDAAGMARTAAEATIEAAGRAVADAELRRETAVTERERGEAAASVAKAALATLEAEARALVKGFEGRRGGGGIKAAPGYERALAAALGDEMEAPVTPDAGWTGAAIGAGDPPLDPRLEPIAPHVSAPAALARRLAQVGIVDSDDGVIALAVGQRVVTRDGAMRRWDGFRARDVGAAAAERLIRINRLSAIELALPQAQTAVAEAGERMAALAAEFAAAKAAGDAARATRTTAEATMRAAIRDEDAAGTAIERLALQRSAIEQRIAVAKDERDEAEAAVATAETALAALPDGSGIAAEVRRLRGASDTARATLASARADAAAEASRIEADRRRIEAARSEARGWRTRAGDAGRRIAEMDRRAAAIESEAAGIAGRPERLDREIADLDAGSRGAAQAADTTRAAERAAEADLRQRELHSRAAAEALSAARETRAAAAARAENQELRRIEMGRISGERFECPAPVLPERIGFASTEVRDAATESQTLERQTVERERLGPVNLVAESELAEIEGERARSVAEREELGQAILRLRGSIGSLNREGRTRLMAAFEAVDVHFRRLFTTLFGGGQAHLALVDSDDPLEAGLEIMAQPPGKRLGSLTLLSGGEQALTAVALIFALFLTNPAPICVLDEVDAPLDDANIERFCDLLDEMTRVTDTRYLIVTHNAVTMSRMHRLFGVTMVERGVSRLVSVDLGGAETLLAAE